MYIYPHTLSHSFSSSHYFISRALSYIYIHVRSASGIPRAHRRVDRDKKRASERTRDNCKSTASLFPFLSLSIHFVSAPWLYTARTLPSSLLFRRLLFLCTASALRGGPRLFRDGCRWLSGSASLRDARSWLWSDFLRRGRRRRRRGCSEKLRTGEREELR